MPQCDIIKLGVLSIYIFAVHVVPRWVVGLILPEVQTVKEDFIKETYFHSYKFLYKILKVNKS